MNSFPLNSAFERMTPLAHTVRVSRRQQDLTLFGGKRSLSSGVEGRGSSAARRLSPESDDERAGPTAEQAHGLYTAAERQRRDARPGPWSKASSLRCSFSSSREPCPCHPYTDDRKRLFAANVSIVVKTLVLYTIMVTGSIWERPSSASISLPPHSSGKMS